MNTTVYVARIEGLADNDWQEVHTTSEDARRNAREHLIDVNYSEKVFIDSDTEEAIAEYLGGSFVLDQHTVFGNPGPRLGHDQLGADSLITLHSDFADIPGAQSDDDVTAIALIDLARWIIAETEPKRLAAIYVPPVDNGDDEDPIPARIECPHCTSGFVVEVDKAIRWNEYDDDEYSTGVLTFDTSGEDGLYETDHYLCTTCHAELDEPDWPEGFEKSYS